MPEHESVKEKQPRPSSKRVFVGVMLDTVIQSKLRETLESWKEEGQLQGNLTQREKLHVTLRFIGDIPNTAVDGLLGDLEAALSPMK